MNTLKSLFLLDPDVTFLNHGSFGATPRPVFAAYQAWQRRLEHQPVKFLGRELFGLLAEARGVLSDYVGCSAENLVFVPNATTGVNIVARSLALTLEPGDEVLMSNHEYGACVRTWTFISQHTGVRIVQQPVPLPADSAETALDHFWRGVTPRTRVIFLSHITSTTAMRMPVAAICARARAAGITTLIDGAHAPGQIALDVAAIGADFYTGNAHKWLMAPKGAAFLYVHPAQHATLEPLIVSWGWGDDPQPPTGNRLLDILQWSGTHDPAAYLAVPAAVAFQAEHAWDTVRQRCHALLTAALRRLDDLTGARSVYPDDSAYAQMAIARLPATTDIAWLKAALYDRYHVEIPLTEWQQQPFIRLSVQGYNSEADIDRLLAALAQLL